ncbi:MAG: PIG-L family deacetylase [Candidatus Binatia bacterium]
MTRPPRGVPRRACGVAVRAALLVALTLACTGVCTAGATERTPRTTVPAPLLVGEHERLLVVAPHPDDEVLGAGGLIQRVLARDGNVHVVLVTAGDGYPDAVRGETGHAAPSQQDYVAYGARRIAEARAALDVLGGADRVQLTVLGFPDGALPQLRDSHWLAATPARSPTTGASAPPYDGLVADATAPYAGEELLDALTRIVRELRPTLVALPDPLDAHGDHATAGLFALAALQDAHSDARVVAYLVHWPSWPPGWDAAAIDPAAATHGLDLPADLPLRGGRTALALSSAERSVKHEALVRHATQQRQMAVYLDAFVRPREPYTLLAASDAIAARAALRAAPATP